MAVRVLIVDDDAFVRRGLCALLETHTDFIVCAEAADGREAFGEHAACESRADDEGVEAGASGDGVAKGRID
jgi:DNA-binding NarL/FixJ family response regulator